jgi:hypothetical protein
MFHLLRKLAALRDGFLVTGALLYALGLAVWSYHAWRNHVGLLPALDMQYFIAGAVPLALVLTAYYVISHGQRAIQVVHAALGPDATGWRLLLRRILSPLMSIGALLLIALPTLVERGLVRDEVAAPFLLASACVFVVIFIFTPWHPHSRLKNSPRYRPLYRMGRLMNPFMMYYLLVVLSVAAVLLFLNVVYPEIPQEFGGVRPRTAVLSIKKDDLPAAVVDKLIDGKPSQAPIVRTRPVQVLFSDEDRLIFRLPNGDARPKTFEMARSALSFIEWQPD